MSDSLLDKYAKRLSGSDDERPDAEPEESGSEGCFGWLRGIRDRALMLELRKKDGRILAIGYSWLERGIELDPDKGIILHLPDRQIHIRGSCLNSEIRPSVRLFNGLARHRVPWIRESDSGEQLSAEENAVLIESISWDD